MAAGVDMVSMARPFLADADLVAKAIAGKADEINTCSASDQGCLDYIVRSKVYTYLVNSRAYYETELEIKPVAATKKRALVGTGPGVCPTLLPPLNGDMK